MIGMHYWINAQRFSNQTSPNISRVLLPLLLLQPAVGVRVVALHRSLPHIIVRVNVCSRNSI